MCSSTATTPWTRPSSTSKPGHEPLVVALHLAVLQRGLEQRVQHVEAGLVGGEPRAPLLHAAERAHGHVAVRLTAPRTTPVLELQQLARCLVDEHLDGVLVAEPVAAGDRVVDVLVEAVVRRDRPRGAALGGDAVAAHRVDLGHHRHVERRIGLRHRDGSTQAGGSPPPTIRTSWAATTASSLTAQLLVLQDPAAMVDDLVVDAAVVELLVMRLAPARRSGGRASPDPAASSVTSSLAVLDPAAGRVPRLEPARGGRHGAPPAPGHGGTCPYLRTDSSTRPGMGRGSRDTPARVSATARRAPPGRGRAPSAAVARRSPGARPSRGDPPGCLRRSPCAGSR